MSPGKTDQKRGKDSHLTSVTLTVTCFDNLVNLSKCQTYGNTFRQPRRVSVTLTVTHFDNLVELVLHLR